MQDQPGSGGGQACPPSTSICALVNFESTAVPLVAIFRPMPAIRCADLELGICVKNSNHKREPHQDSDSASMNDEALRQEVVRQRNSMEGIR